MLLVVELSKILKSTSSVHDYWNIIQKWEKTFTKDICLHLITYIDDLLKKCSNDIDISHISTKLLSVKEFIIDHSDLYHQGNPVFDNTTQLKEIFECLINSMAQKWRVGTSRGKRFEDSEKWTTSQFLDIISNKVETFYRNTSEVTKEKVNSLTTMFIDKCEQLVYTIYDVYKEETTFLSSWLSSCKLVMLISSILEIIDNIFEYLSSLTSFTFDIPLEIGWEPYDVNELAIILNDLEIVNTKRKKRSRGHH